jgi:hypothetical protein
MWHYNLPVNFARYKAGQQITYAVKTVQIMLQTGSNAPDFSL